MNLFTRVKNLGFRKAAAIVTCAAVAVGGLAYAAYESPLGQKMACEHTIARNAANYLPLGENTRVTVTDHKASIQSNYNVYRYKLTRTDVVNPDGEGSITTTISLDGEQAQPDVASGDRLSIRDKTLINNVRSAFEKYSL